MLYITTWRHTYTPPPSQNFRGDLFSSVFCSIWISSSSLPSSGASRLVLTWYLVSNPLLSIVSTGSSGIIWVTLGRVSSALSTGKVLDRNLSVWFRISSLWKQWCVIWNAYYVKLTKKQALTKDMARLKHFASTGFGVSALYSNLRKYC